MSLLRLSPDVVVLLERIATALEDRQSGCGADPDGADMDLLRKIAQGTGGRRTGILMRLGLLECRVTNLGEGALEEAFGEGWDGGEVSRDGTLLISESESAE